MYGYFKQQTGGITDMKTWTWLRKGNLMRETESLLIVGQNNAIKNNYIKAKMNNTKQNNKFRLKDRDETADHIITQKKYKTRLN